MVFRVSSMCSHKKHVKGLLVSAFAFEIIAVFGLLTAGSQFMTGQSLMFREACFASNKI